MGSLTVMIVFLSDSSARTFGTKKVAPNSIRQIMPVNILRYMFKSPFKRSAPKFISPRYFVREIERHSQYQTVSKRIARKERYFSHLRRPGFFVTAALAPRVRHPGSGARMMTRGNGSEKLRWWPKV